MNERVSIYAHIHASAVMYVNSTPEENWFAVIVNSITGPRSHDLGEQSAYGEKDACAEKIES